MGKLWIFGDSFTNAPLEKRMLVNDLVFIEETKKDFSMTWQSLLCQKLGLSEICNHGMPGIGLDYIQWRYVQERTDIDKENDVIIIGHTMPARRWFIQKSPELSNFINFIKTDSTLNVEYLKKMTARHDPETRQKSFYQAEAARQYVINIADPVMEELYGVSVLAYFNMQQHEGYQIINIPIYENSEVTKWNNNFNSIGNLNSVSANEWQSEKRDEQSLWTAFMDICGGADGRVNHLIMDNHTILADKLFKTITENETLDLTTGFISNIVNATSYDSKYDVYKMKQVP
tara:strand:+ start:366 stop:1229 length:864 start_codon:yes stop_codon:yes gene_type:complete